MTKPLQESINPTQSTFTAWATTDDKRREIPSLKNLDRHKSRTRRRMPPPTAASVSGSKVGRRAEFSSDSRKIAERQPLPEYGIHIGPKGLHELATLYRDRAKLGRLQGFAS